ncbi:MAG: tetratricopeptide repeat protein [Caldilineae bacterium]|nr:MAG: tetratricopeptide repeat protein [Caldilineae bacterium]
MSEVLLHELSRELRRLLEEERDFEAGFALGRHILRHYPRHLRTYRQMGLACVQAGLYADAVDVLHRALSADPEDADMWSALGRAAELLGMNKEAERARRCAEDLRGRGTTAAARARAAALAAHWEESARRFRQAMHRQPERMDIALGLATAYLHLREPAICRGLAESVLAQLPYSLKANWLVVRCAAILGDEERDRQHHLAIARSLDPDDQYAWQWFAAEDRTPPAPSARIPSWDGGERWPLRPQP